MHERSTLSADRLLFEGTVQGLIIALYQNERPPYGLAGLMDWYFQGRISESLKKGFISGVEGECSYFPLHKRGVHHLIFVGAGRSETPGKRSKLAAAHFAKVKKNLLSLNTIRFGLSLSDFGLLEAPSSDDTAGEIAVFKGVPLWLSP